MSIGERIDGRRYFYHPPSGWTDDGRPLDAGTAHIIHSNLSHLGEQNHRLIAHTPGPGYLPPNDTGDKLWENVVEYGRPSNASMANYNRRPWTQPLNCVRFGPFAAVFQDLSADPPGFLSRQFRVMVDGTHNADGPSDLSVAAALTASPTPPPLSGDILVIEEQRFSATGADFRADFTFAPTDPLRPTESWRCRPQAGAITAATVARVSELWVWVYWDSGFAGDAIWSISVFEVVEP